MTLGREDSKKNMSRKSSVPTTWPKGTDISLVDKNVRNPELTGSNIIRPYFTSYWAPKWQATPPEPHSLWQLDQSLFLKYTMKVSHCLPSICLEKHLVTLRSITGSIQVLNFSEMHLIFTLSFESFSMILGVSSLHFFLVGKIRKQSSSLSLSSCHLHYSQNIFLILAPS